MPPTEHEIDLKIGREDLTSADRERAVRELREALRGDPARPAWHLLPPEGFWNDINGTTFWKGRYHVFFLGRRCPPREAILSGKDTLDAREVWLHASSRDLVHWVDHPVALMPAWDGSMPRGIYSGDMIENAPTPTLIVHIPGQGTCLYTAEDDMLDDWKWFPGNPVIRPETAPKEVTVFDPTGWYDEGTKTYYALVGNNNRTPGFEGDCTSLYKATELSKWEYVGPFYKSRREWTEEVFDLACPDFFPMGGRHMLLSHAHQPYYMSHYYLGRLEGERFIPEAHGRMTWPGGSLCAPESLIDGKGRRLFWGWVYEQGPHDRAWGSVATLPRVLEPDPVHGLRITPAVELESLRMESVPVGVAKVSPGVDAILDTAGDSLEIAMDVEPGAASVFGIRVLRSPDGAEETSVVFDLEAGTLSVDFSKSRLGAEGPVKYPRYREDSNKKLNVPESEWFTSRQTAPFKLGLKEPLRIRLFVDRSILEVFANERQCVTQRVYPSRADSKGVALYSRGGDVTIKSGAVYGMERVNSW